MEEIKQEFIPLPDDETDLIGGEGIRSGSAPADPMPSRMTREYSEFLHRFDDDTATGSLWTMPSVSSSLWMPRSWAWCLTASTNKAADMENATGKSITIESIPTAITAAMPAVQSGRINKRSVVNCLC